MKEMILLPALCVAIGSIVWFIDGGSGIALGISLGAGLLFLALIGDAIGDRIIRQLEKGRLQDADVEIVQIASKAAALGVYQALEREKKKED